MRTIGDGEAPSASAWRLGGSPAVLPAPPRVLFPRSRTFLAVEIRPCQPEGCRRWRSRATRRRAISGRPPLYGRGPPLLPGGEPLLYRGRHGLLVRRGVPWPPHRQWRGL